MSNYDQTEMSDYNSATFEFLFGMFHIVAVCLHVCNCCSLCSFCQELGVQVFASEALGPDELASGRYTPSNPTGGEIGTPRFTLAHLMPLRRLCDALESVAARARQRCEKSVETTQVALQWVVSKGASPLCDVSSKANADALVGCRGWRLTDEEVAILDKASDEVCLKL